MTMLINSSASSLRPVTLPADFASTSLTYASAPLGTITLLSTTIGASSEALNICPAWFVFESMLSIVRTVTIVFAGTVTVTGWGAGGGAGAAAGGAAAGAGVGSAIELAGAAAAVCRGFSALGEGFAFAMRLARAASRVGAAACGTEICAVATLIWSFTRVTPLVSEAIL